MASRRKKAVEAKELAEITPTYVINELRRCLYRTHDQKATARNYEDTTEAISVFVRKRYPETADEITTKRKSVATKPRMPRKPRKRRKKRGIKRLTSKGTDVKLEESLPVDEKPFSIVVGPKIPVPPPPPPVKRDSVDDVISLYSDSDPSTDEEYEDSLYEYEEKMDQYDCEKKRYMKKVDSIENGRMYARDVILAQCTREMREKLSSKGDFERAKNESDIIGLLGLIKTCGLDFSDEGYLFQNVIHVLRDLLTHKQGSEETNHDFREGLETRLQKFEKKGGSISDLFKIKDDEFADLTPEEIKERLLTVVMIDQSCDERFGDFKRDRSEDAHLGRTDFPATRVRASISLDNHCNTIPRPRPTIDKG